MSEAMLTREQLLHLMKEAPDEYPEWIWEKLVTMALASIAMREALKPFAEKAGKYDGYRDSITVLVPIGDLRRAAAAYQEQGK